MEDTLRSGLLSVVLPSYNEEASIPRAADTITAILIDADIPHELVFVDDGSRDRTWTVIQEQAGRHPQVRGVRFSRNFGKEAAIFAGLAQARGDCTLVMDCDLQHPPEKAVEMYRLWQEGYQVVEGVKASRGKENPLHTFAAKSFYSIISRATGIDMSRASDFKLLDRRAVDTLLAMREKNAFFRALSSWIGFQTTQVEFEVQPRLEGESKWSIRSLVRYAITNITSFSAAPLQLVTLLGVVVFLCSVALGIHSLWQWASGNALEGFTTIILLQLFIGSILMICLGVIGYYIAKIYEEIKDRPRYIVAERCEGDRDEGTAKKDI
ncbi:glycosyltransferase family 2 protein [Muriventricola aceti]|uniref:glycosyltransferase family 2 protein n=1 Tax=Muriventricola aceti TaxID=2981773 RepID=UPI000821AD0A|nr:glycosyltransferase family 2 protein [Muriventricola aceti]MCU6702944.1 glycosyltransferase family 2 protein [Muriventricola aceti]SCJ27604.1 Bactoprenol glucosyl transferase homolog from prophage CPS-53 [uncultured Flavonifractor sp.]